MVGGYITTHFDSLSATGLSYLDFGVANFIHILSVSRTSKHPGWCYISKGAIAERFNISRRTVVRILTKLEADGWMERGDNPRFVKSTLKWENLVVDQAYKEGNKLRENSASNCANMAQNKKRSETKCLSRVRQNVSQDCAKMSHNNNIDNNSNSNTNLSGEPELVQAVKKDHPILYEKLLESHSFQERICRLIQSENLKADFHSDVVPIIHQWMKTNWVAGSIHSQPANKLVSQCTSFIHSVLKNGGLKSGSGSQDLPEVIRGPKGMKSS